MNKLLLLAGLLIPYASRSQCPSAVTLTSSGNCQQGLLTLGTTATPTSITWNKDGTALSTTAVNTNPTIYTVAGGNGDGPANNQIGKPLGVWVDAAGNVYIADGIYDRVEKWAPGATSGVIVAGGNGAGNASNQLNYPQGIAVDASGNLYVVDDGNARVQKWAPGAASGVTVAGGNGVGGAANQLAFPNGLYVNGSGDIYVADGFNNRIQLWTPGATTGITVAGGNGAGSAANQLYSPTGVWVDATGAIYVADQSNFRIQKWARGASYGVTVAGGNGLGSAANQMDPFGVCVDAAGNIYVDDYYNECIQLWVPGATSGIIVAGGNGAGSAANQFDVPYFCYIDNRNDIYVSDYLNFRVQQWTTVNSINTQYMATSPGSYTATVTYSSGCTLTTAPQVIDGTPDISLALTRPAGATGNCPGDTLKLSSTNNLAQLTWYKDASPLRTVIVPTTPGILDSTFISDQAGSYTALLTTNGGCTATIGPMVVDAGHHPTVTINASATNICPGTGVNFTATPIDGGTQPQYQWSINGQNIPGNSATWSDAGLTNAAVVSCVMTSNAGCPSPSSATSNSISFVVYPPPMIQPGQVFAVSPGQSVQLDPAVTGDITSYLWTPATGLSNTSVSDPVASPTATTTYTLTVTSDEGCTGSGDITVKVHTSLRIPSGFTPNGDGKNDVFYVLGAPAGVVIKAFSVYNRWGEAMFQLHDATPGNAGVGWNGNYKGAPAPAGTYVYVIELTDAGGATQVLKGTVMLIR